MADSIPTPAAVDPAAPAVIVLPAKNWFAKLDPAYRAVIVFVLSTVISVLWAKCLPGTPVPTIPAVAPVAQTPAPVVVLAVGGQPVSATLPPASK